MNITTACLVAVVVLAVGQAIATFMYVLRLSHYRDFFIPSKEWPRALVVLSLRGGDARLEDCLNGLVNQDYSWYRIKIIIDHPTDPAAEVVERWRAAGGHLHVGIEYLIDPSQSATLKCSAVLQAVRDLDDDIQAVVIVDGDAIAYPNWLHDLMAPLAQPGIGAVTGNRWYFPEDASLGGWCRFVYNGLALPAMDALALTWGGSLAVSREVAKSHVFLESLKRAPCEDQAVRKALAALRLQCHFTPRVILLNQEGCSLKTCMSFVFRQLLWTRLYHPAWAVIFGHAVCSYILLAVTFVFAVLGSVNPPCSAGTKYLWAALGIYMAIVVVSLLAIDSVVRSVALRRNKCAEALSLATKLKTTLLTTWAAPAALILYTVSIAKAALANKVVWRGVEYRIQSESGLRIVAYQPLASRGENAIQPFHGQSPDRLSVSRNLSTELS